MPWCPSKAPVEMIARPQPRQVTYRTAGGFTAPGITAQGLPAPDSQRGWANVPTQPGQLPNTPEASRWCWQPAAGQIARLQSGYQPSP